MCSPNVRRNSGIMSGTVAVRLIGAGINGCLRAKASNWLVRVAPRCAAQVARSIRACKGSERSMRVRVSSRFPRITVSRLLKSCAMPPVSWPIACIFWDSRNTASAWTRLVMSEMVSTKPPSGVGVRRNSR